MNRKNKQSSKHNTPVFKHPQSKEKRIVSPAISKILKKGAISSTDFQLRASYGSPSPNISRIRSVSSTTPTGRTPTLRQSKVALTPSSSSSIPTASIDSSSVTSSQPLPEDLKKKAASLTDGLLNL